MIPPSLAERVSPRPLTYPDTRPRGNPSSGRRYRLIARSLGLCIATLSAALSAALIVSPAWSQIPVGAGSTETVNGPRVTVGQVVPCDACATSTARVYVLDGAGDYSSLTDAMISAARTKAHAVEIVPFPWSHGFRRVLADQTDYPWMRCKGKLLAETLLRDRQAFPDAPFHIVAHSAGAQVALSALENLPANVVQRVVFLAPSVSATYDLKPALLAVQESMIVYHSHRDWLVLGVVTRVIGSTDRQFGPVSGRVGFRTCFGPEDAWLAEKLDQRAWRLRDCFAGNPGRHSSGIRPRYLSGVVVPSMLTSGLRAMGSFAMPPSTPWPPQPLPDVLNDFTRPMPMESPRSQPLMPNPLPKKAS